MRLLLLFIEYAPTVAEVDRVFRRVNDTLDKWLHSNLDWRGFVAVCLCCLP